MFQQLRDDFIGEVMLELTLNTGKRQKDSDKKEFDAGIPWQLVIKIQCFHCCGLGFLSCRRAHRMLKVSYTKGNLNVKLRDAFRKLFIVTKCLVVKWRLESPQIRP